MAVPSHSFVAYIDEAGDEGFKFEKGSSEWFVLSAVVARRTRDTELVHMIRESLKELNKPKNHVLHFRKLDHYQRVFLIDRVATAPCRVVTVLVHKRSLGNPTFQRRSIRGVWK
jgi:Protein of unknown function (DUF3800)